VKRERRREKGMCDCEPGDDVEVKRYDADLDLGGGRMQVNAAETAMETLVEIQSRTAARRRAT